MITGPAGHHLMLDCGLCSDRPWNPFIAYMGERIDTLMLMNLDEDHCEDLPHLWRDCPIGGLVTNPTVDARGLRLMKAECGMRAGVAAATDILERVGTGFLGNWSHDLGGVAWHVFWNRHAVDFTDSNNLSLAAFVRFGPFTILFGGDLERPGWRQLLKNPAFRAKLATTVMSRLLRQAPLAARWRGCQDPGPGLQHRRGRGRSTTSRRERQTSSARLGAPR